MVNGSSRSDARKRREHVIPDGGAALPGHDMATLSVFDSRNDTARTVATSARTILATISLRDDSQRERTE